MKYTKHLLIVSAVLMLLSSCGSLSITQKRYSRGLNIDWFVAKDDAAPAKTSKKKQTPVKSELIAVENSQVKQDKASEQVAEVVETIQVEMATPEIAIPELKQLPASNKPAIELSKVTKELPGSVVSKKESKSKLNRVKQTLKAAKKADADVETLVLIILAILIPPLAVFLYYMELNGQFWLSILLVILAAIAFFLVISKLIYLAAIIHALLVVLGMLG
jgi:uncharacterized membrane protein YqaE (UPF0057 family)/urease gamma subunit